MIKISPSILAADITNLGRDIKKIDSVSDMIHIDVMDGHFVPNLSYGVPVVKGIRSITEAFLDVHIMIDNPLKFIEPFYKAGADLITFHIEANDDATECVKLIKSLGIKCGVALNPDTNPKDIECVANDVDMVLQMTVFPGFGGQGMVKSAIDNISIIRKMIGNEKDLQVDGGIYLENCNEVVKAGANVIVCGTAVFGNEDPTAAVKEIRKRASL